MMHPARQAYVEEARDAEQDDDIDISNVRMGIHPPMVLDPETNVEEAVDRDYLMPSSVAGVAPEKASAIMAQFSHKRRLAATAVPTDDGKVNAEIREMVPTDESKVKLELRKMGEPITLFGEGPGDRRDRLRELWTIRAEQEAGEDDISMEGEAEGDGAQTEQDEEFYTEGIPELLTARQDIARYSIPRAKVRLEYQRHEAKIPLRTHIKHRKPIKEKLSKFELLGSQVAGERPVSLVRFAPNGEFVAAGNWAGGIRLLEVPSLNLKKSLQGHTDRVGGIAWYPGATLPSSNISPSAVNFATSGGDGKVNLWSLEQDEPLSTLEGHTSRVCRVEFHPSGKYLASASYDTSWRLWDVATSTELLLQEGHSRELYALSFQTDGSLLATGGLDSIGRIWDLRTGRTIMVLDGHVREIYALDWSVDGHRVLSGSGDGWVKCWDVRKVQCIQSVGAHKKGVTDLRWYKGLFDPAIALEAVEKEKKGGGEMTPKTAATFFVSGGFDKKVNVFSADDWPMVKSLDGHSANVLGVDVSHDAKWIASCGHDRTVKIWGRDEAEEL
ncbi:MAG: hypothetical protein LQ342_007666 [Letrouitia transgressa]|nr:MAG: hypothetical protein LQ342_007666 [Letrouitia transgressa]